MTYKFITGQESLDNFDAFVEQIKSQDIEDAIEIQQAALDRYNAR
jgi:putative aldouronate transport system substrate-binding protein